MKPSSDFVNGILIPPKAILPFLEREGTHVCEIDNQRLNGGAFLPSNGVMLILALPELRRININRSGIALDLDEHDTWAELCFGDEHGLTSSEIVIWHQLRIVPAE